MKLLLSVALAAYAFFGLNQTALADNYTVCQRCGTVKHIDSFTEKRSGTGGAVVGGVVGGLVGNQIGGGSGKTLATVAGVVGGAVVGKKIAESNDVVEYDITVKMDNGEKRVLTQTKLGNVRVGSRVQVKNGKVSLLK